MNIRFWRRERVTGPVSRRIIAIREIRAFLFLTYPGCVFAANNALGTQFSGYTPATWAILALLIGLGGVTGMLHRLQSEQVLNGEVRSLKLFIASNLFGAGVAGVIAFLGGEGMGLQGWVIAIGVLVASFAGSLAIERVWKAWAKKNLPIDDEPKTGNFNERVYFPPAVRPEPAQDPEPPQRTSLGPRNGITKTKGHGPIGNEGKFD